MTARRHAGTGPLYQDIGRMSKENRRKKIPFFIFVSRFPIDRPSAIAYTPERLRTGVSSSAEGGPFQQGK
jgi:hypothetical protein